MRSVNLIPEELRPHIPGDGDPRIAYGVLGGLAVVLVMVLLAINLSNQLKTIEDQTAAITAEAQTHKTTVAAVTTTPDQVASDVKSRTLLVGGLAKTRFPWADALDDLTHSVPPDTTLSTIAVASGGTAVGSDGTSSGSMILNGCTSSWVGYSRFMTWLKTMPGVMDVESTSSSIGAAAAGGDDADRTKNCGPVPLGFALTVTYAPRTIDLLGLPKPDDAGPSGATGGVAGAVPAASATPAPAAPPAGAEN
jgi:Tfp pilus assembly protein PilN